MKFNRIVTMPLKLDILIQRRLWVTIIMLWWAL